MTQRGAPVSLLKLADELGRLHVEMNGVKTLVRELVAERGSTPLPPKLAEVAALLGIEPVGRPELSVVE